MILLCWFMSSGFLQLCLTFPFIFRKRLANKIRKLFICLYTMKLISVFMFIYLLIESHFLKSLDHTFNLEDANIKSLLGKTISLIYKSLDLPLQNPVLRRMMVKKCSYLFVYTDIVIEMKSKVCI